MDKYYKNLILCGNIDYFCLLCQESFETTVDLDKHIRWENHRKYLKITNGVAGKDFLYKVENNIYCQICNQIVTTNVKKHLKDARHLALKNNNEVKEEILIKRESNGLISLSNLKITERQWHSVSDGECGVCKTKVELPSSHITKPTHMINLILSEIVYNNDNYYRKIKEELFYCFKCFKTVSNESLSDHSTKYHNLTSDNTKNKESKDKPRTDSSEDENETMYTEYTAFPPLGFDHGKHRLIIAKYGRSHYIKLNEGGSWGFCSLCNIYVSANINSVIHHVKGSRHRGHLELKGLKVKRKNNRPNCAVEPFKDFLEDTMEMEKFKLVCIKGLNEKDVAVTFDSFQFISPIDDRNPRCMMKRCYACDLDTNFIEMYTHKNSKEHYEKVMASKVMLITESEFEFVRMIRNDLYHCGPCNLVFPFWTTMKRHLKTMQHKGEKVKMVVQCRQAQQWFIEEHMGNMGMTLDDLRRL